MRKNILTSCSLKLPLAPSSVGIGQATSSRAIFAILFLSLFFQPINLSAQADIKAIDTYIDAARKAWDIPGMAVGIVKDGEVVLSKGYGVLEAGEKKKANEHSLFAIASNSKAFTSAAIAILVDEGKLGWNDPVVQYLPYLELYDPYVTQSLTVRDLLCHRAGLGTFSGDVMWYKTALSAEEVIRQIKYLPAAYNFRAGYGYSNLMFITAGAVIEEVSGISWHDFIRTHILAPLEMDRTQTSVSGLEEMSNVASPHKPIDGKNEPIAWVNWDNMAAAGGIVSSASDMTHWMQMQLDEGLWADGRIFSESAQSEMWHPHSTRKLSKRSKSIFPGRNFVTYGLGWELFDYHGRKVVDHGGGYDGMYSKVALIPDEGLGLVILTNGMKGVSTYLMYYIFDAFLGLENPDWSEKGLSSAQGYEDFKKERIEKRINERKTNTTPALPLEDYAGSYHCDMYGNIEVKLDGEHLRLNFENAPKMNARLSHWHFNTFRIEWDNVHAWFDFGTVQFILDNDANPVEMRFDVPNDDIFFEELKIYRSEP